MSIDTLDLEQPEVPQETENRIRFEQVISSVWVERKKILLLSLTSALLALAIGFLLPVYYKSTVVLLPETDKSRLGSLSQIAGLASLAGMDVPGGMDISRLYPSILTSESVLRGVIEKRYATARFTTPVDLIAYLELDESTQEENFDKALKLIRSLMSASLEAKTNIVTASLEMQEPQLSADVLNTVIAETDKFMRQKKTTNASQQRKWVEERLMQVEVELRSSEESLKNFRERNRRVGDSPQLLLQMERLLRDVQVKSTMFIELTKQAELAKIEEIKNITVVNVLDEARPPVRKERPKKVIISAVVFLLVFFGAVGYYGFLPFYKPKLQGLLLSRSQRG